MEDRKDVKHQFDLSGMSLGEWFLGCEKCWNQYPKNALAKPCCDRCGCRMNRYQIRQSDLDVAA
jgi:rRNA maturation endonuclease Nob1